VNPVIASFARIVVVVVKIVLDQLVRNVPTPVVNAIISIAKGAQKTILAKIVAKRFVQTAWKHAILVVKTDVQNA